MSKIQFDNDNMDEVRLNEDVNMVVFYSIEINDCFSIGVDSRALYWTQFNICH
jgi:hypothetical protein